MNDALAAVWYALAEGRLHFRTRAALERHQQRLAREQLRWVAAYSPAVAARFRAAGLGLSQWHSLPPTGKAEMMAQFDHLNTAGLKLAEVLALARSAEDQRDFSGQLRGAAPSAFAGQPLTVGLSSGTSGTQGAFLVGTTERQRWAGVVLRHLLPPPFFRSLLRPQRVAFLLRAEGGLYRSVQSRRISFTFLDLLRPVPELAAALSAADPTLLVGPPSVLRALLEAGAVARPERVVCVAEVLEPDDRAALEAGFGPVVQVYQATEGLLALPCSHGHLHLNEAHVHFDLEALGDGRWRPIITDLRRRVQPMIRHRLDDILHLDGAACPCGSAARRVIRIEGRQDDALAFASPSGSLVTVWPDFVRAALNRVPGLREYRAEQTAPHTLRLLLDPDSPEVRAHAAAEVAAALTRAGADAGRVHLTFGPLLPAPPGTKRRRVLRRREAGSSPIAEVNS
ncbi:F390 synthetase-related protein [Deinococcus aquatilis]|jgi:putative adenylate-forming enzyme|uniref:F390 synthetase-related protein n=1 Tax=Deinococcus aquatilis TaxID=519440 RepID=UPI00036C8C1C|nr:F390 synthetase-related protein [Deinococcus aquatilis]